MGTTTLSHYRILELLGKGGMGEVYRAEDTTLGREVAIKVLPEEFTSDPDRLARFEREAKLLATLNHPHIAQIHALEEVDGQRLLVMELVEGETLAERLSRGALPAEEALPVALQITQALEAAHERGIVHRDLKPANIKITPGGEIKVLDFGLAKPITDAASSDLSHSPTLTYSPTRAGVLLGTASYMSPEQARGQEVDRRTDIWSFGVLLWEMLTGQQLFDGETVSDVLAGVLKEEPPWDRLPPDLPRPIGRALHRCLTRDLKERLHDIADARLEIEEAIALPERASAGPLKPPRPSSLWTRLRTSWWSVPAALVVGALVVSIAWWLSTRSPAPPAKPIRTSFTVPDGVFIGTSERQERSLAVSPDGEWVVFAAQKDGVSRLFKRSLGGFEITEIPGSENASQPFFSPDGSRIGFFDRPEGKLKTLPLLGGQATALWDVVSPYGGAWLPDGSIVFNPRTFAGLWRIPESGGQAEPILSPKPEDGVTDYYEPFPLPDGEGLLFTAFRGGITPAPDHVGILDLATGQSSLLIEDAVSARQIPSGHLVFSRGGRVEVAPFDLSARKVTGPAVPVAESIGYGSLTMIPDLAVSNTGTLAYLPGVPNDQRVVTFVDLKGREISSLEARGNFMTPIYSPDGRELAVTVVEPRGASLWLVNPRTGAQTRLPGEGEMSFPVWSTDGKRIAFSMATQDPPASWSIYRQKALGAGAPELLVAAREPGETLRPYDWTPDGKTLLFEAYTPRDRSSIWYLTMDDKKTPERLAVSVGSFPDQAKLSPDGHWIAFLSYESGRPNLCVQSFPTGEELQQVSVERAQSFLGWSSDGGTLFFAVAVQPGHFTTPGEWDVFEARVSTAPRLEAGKPSKLFRGTFAPGLWTSASIGSVSPDGRHFVMVKPDEGSRYANEIRVVFNWFEELERLAPTSGN